ncbi:hypothetical protein DH2020_003274 [Rehmannia glutinosa]|uniref:Lysosomal beta A mannosidase n=1 Tax=Rehmannia glutinosa TaxID=99300 RepID=A0ABR0XLA6_REHGL
MAAAIGKRVLDEGWLAARSTEVDLTGVELTTTHPPSHQSPWMEAVVPGTVLATLVKNKLVPDPFYGLQNEAIIDIADSGRQYYTFWFFTTFECKLVSVTVLPGQRMQRLEIVKPTLSGSFLMIYLSNLSQSTNQHVDLNFRAINYSAEVYLNGHKGVVPKGMFRRHSIDVTDIINSNGENMLAVLVYPPDHPGRTPPEGGHEIRKDVAAQYVDGWDWMAPIRDRNTGIWDEVSLCVTGPVKIVDPHLVSSFFDNYKRVYLHTTMELANKSDWVAECTLNIQVGTELEGDICTVEHLHTQNLSIPAASQIQYTLPESEENLTPNPGDLPHRGSSLHINSISIEENLFFYKPSLWWPNGMGNQSLYNVEITVDVKGHGESDSWRQHFGFKIESHIDSKTGGRIFKVNGQPIFIRGGNWISSDGLLRLSKKRYETAIKFHADMNFNMIRCWGGGLAERPEFYHYCDIYGLLVWQEFWITGDCDAQGVPLSNPVCPLDHDLFLLCARDTIKLLRNHPSLALWVGGNERAPPDDINMALKKDLILHPYFQGSSDLGMPVAATVRSTIPPYGWQIPLFKELPNGYIQEVPNPIWNYHKYIPHSKPELVHNQILLYGTPKDLDDFCLKAQLVNYTQYRALLEGWTSRMWSKYTGVLIWKTQNPWTGLRGQLYDHLHEQTAGFYGCRRAAEPIHVQLNLATYYVEVVNTTSEELSDLAIEASVWDLEGACPYNQVSDKLTLPPKRTLSVFEMKYPKSENPKPIYFLLLKLYKRSDHEMLSRNFYWLHLPGGDYKLLEPYKKNIIPLKITSLTFIRGSTYEVRMHIANTSKKPDSRNALFFRKHCERDFDMPLKTGGKRVTEINGSKVGVAFFLHLSVHASKGDYREGEDTRVLPVHYSDNYFSLVPGEVTTISLKFEVPHGITPRVKLHGWNYRHGHTLL